MLLQPDACCGHQQGRLFSWFCSCGRFEFELAAASIKARLCIFADFSNLPQKRKERHTPFMTKAFKLILLKRLLMLESILFSESNSICIESDKDNQSSFDLRLLVGLSFQKLVSVLQESVDLVQLFLASVHNQLQNILLVFKRRKLVASFPAWAVALTCSLSLATALGHLFHIVPLLCSLQDNSGNIGNTVFVSKQN